jgi:hypothetical protein
MIFPSFLASICGMSHEIHSPLPAGACTVVWNSDRVQLYQVYLRPYTLYLGSSTEGMG